MRRSGVVFAVLAAAVMLTACTGDNAAGRGDNELITSSETAQTEPRETETTTAAITSASETVSEAAAEKLGGKRPTVIPANEVYEIYPTRIIYPEETKTDITAEIVKIEEELYNPNGVNVCDFLAEYPVFSGGDETVMRKINADIKKYMESRLEEARKEADNDPAAFDPDAEEDFLAEFVELYGALEEQDISVGSAAWNEETENFYTVCGNVLSVRFTDYVYSAGAAHGMYGSMIMNYDLRTGESIDFNDYLSDAKGLRREFYKETLLFYCLNETPFVASGADIAEFVNSELAEAEENDFYRGSEENGYFYKENIVTGNGCMGTYLAPYEWGSFVSGVRLIEMPLDRVMPYLTDEGKALFEGAVSAKSEPANVIEYKGKRCIDTAPYIPAFENITLTDIDYEFIALFPYLFEIEFENCRNIDFEKIAAVGNTRTLYLYECEFDDISPLFGSNIDYLHGAGNNISKEQAEKFKETEGNFISPDLIKTEDNNE